MPRLRKRQLRCAWAGCHFRQLHATIPVGMGFSFSLSVLRCTTGTSSIPNPTSGVTAARTPQRRRPRHELAGDCFGTASIIISLRRERQAHILDFYSYSFSICFPSVPDRYMHSGPRVGQVIGGASHAVNGSPAASRYFMGRNRSCGARPLPRPFPRLPKRHRHPQVLLFLLFLLFLLCSSVDRYLRTRPVYRELERC